MTKSMVNEYPILFNGEMVRAILNGRKTQTRRVVKLTPGGNVKEPRGHRQWHPEDPAAVKACPVGCPGDRLWVREAFIKGYKTHPQNDCLITEDEDGNEIEQTVWYRADDNDGFMWLDEDGYLCENTPWKPSIHMPRSACRIVIEVVTVRVERVQEISEADAIAEGADFVCTSCGWDIDTEKGNEMHWCCDSHPLEQSHLFDFRNGWNEVHKSKCHDWESNPWVWVVEFKPIEVSP